MHDFRNDWFSSRVKSDLYKLHEKNKTKKHLIYNTQLYILLVMQPNHPLFSNEIFRCDGNRKPKEKLHLSWNKLPFKFYWKDESDREIIIHKLKQHKWKTVWPQIERSMVQICFISCQCRFNPLAFNLPSKYCLSMFNVP